VHFANSVIIEPVLALAGFDQGIWTLLQPRRLRMNSSLTGGGAGFSCRAGLELARWPFVSPHYSNSLLFIVKTRSATAA
jgi:hypothetical protein